MLVDPVQSACSCSAMVRVFAPDAAEKLTTGRAFFDACDGISVLSASGCVLPSSFDGGDGGRVLVATSTTLLVPLVTPVTPLGEDRRCTHP